MVFKSDFNIKYNLRFIIMKIEKDIITDIKVFKNINPSTIDEIVEKSDIITLKKNECLYKDRQVLEYVYFVLKGKVYIAKCNRLNELKIIFLINKFNTINQPLMMNNTSAVECWGYEDTEILRIRFDVFDKLMSNDYILAKNCMLYMEKRIRSLYRQLKNTSNTNIKERLASKLFKLSLEYGVKEDYMTKIDLKITVTHLSKMLGCQRETLSRAIKDLKDDNSIKIINQKFYIDIQKIKKLSNGSN